MKKQLTSIQISALEALSDHGVKQIDLSKRFNVSQSTICRIIKRIKERKTYERKPGSGAKRKLSVTDMSYLVSRIIKIPDIGSKRLCTELKDKKGTTVSARTIRRCLSSAGLPAKITIYKPKLSKNNIKKRFEHAKQWILFDQNDWDNIIWSDETKINLFGSDGRVYVRSPPGKRYEKRRIKPTVKYGGGNVMVWGCFSSKGIGNLHFIEGIMDSISYKNILRINLMESANKMRLSHFLFQQDNDRKHTSKLVKEYLLKNKMKVMDWPSQSPDMNPIEHLWAYLKRNVETRCPKSIKELKVVIKEEWEKIPVDYCKKLVGSMFHRVDDLYRAKGGHTSY